METFRVVLNEWNQKYLSVISPGDAQPFVRITKRGEPQDDFTLSEILDFLESRHDISLKMTNHLHEKSCSPVTYDRLTSHLVSFVYLRDKPFVLFEREDRFREVKGVPQFCRVYIGLTSWTSIWNNKDEILHALRD